MHIYCSFPHALKNFSSIQCCSLPMLAVFISWKISASFPIAVRNRAKQGKNPILLWHTGFMNCHLKKYVTHNVFRIKDQRQLPSVRHYLTMTVFNHIMDLYSYVKLKSLVIDYKGYVKCIWQTVIKIHRAMEMFVPFLTWKLSKCFKNFKCPVNHFLYFSIIVIHQK